MLYIFNTTIVPCECIARVQKISIEEASDLLWNRGFANLSDIETIFRDDLSPTFRSAIGHRATSDVFNTLFGLSGSQAVTVNREHCIPQPFDVALVLKIDGRLPEGKILTVEEMNEIGFSFWKIGFFDPEWHIAPQADLQYVF